MFRGIMDHRSSRIQTFTLFVTRGANRRLFGAICSKKDSASIGELQLVCIQEVEHRRAFPE